MVEAAAQTEGLVGALGFEFVEASGDRVTLRFTVQPQHLQPYGLVHGGVYCAAVETAASVGAALWLGDRGQVVGVSNQTDFLRAVRSGELTAVATPIHRGRTQQLWQVEITDTAQRLIARGQVRLQNLSSAAGLGSFGDRLTGPDLPLPAGR
ncbi:MAG TPA: PaaI family thioesterase [Micromonospora sp.]